MKNVSARQYFEKGSGMVTLCGSTRFFSECMEANRALTFQNWVVLMCGSWGHSYHKGAEPLDRDYSLVKKLHFHKILESDVIVVVSDKSLYYGESTTEEIAFAQYRKKPVFYFDGEFFSGWETIDRIPDRYADTSLIDSFRLKLAVK
jgi:hypothetical protein